MDEKLTRETQLILSRAKIAMFESHPFYAHILTRLQFEFVESLPGGSASGTDGRTVYIRPKPQTVTLQDGSTVMASGYLDQSKGEQVTTLAHEQLHCLAGHLWRTGEHDPWWANVAQDIQIYHILRSEGFVTLHDNETALSNILARDGVYTLDSFSDTIWEEIYDCIAPPRQPQGCGGQDGDSQGQPSAGDGDKGGCGHCYTPQPANSAAAKQAQEEWKQWVREAGTYARMAGSQPGAWCEWVKAATPQVPFETRFFEALKLGLGGEQSYQSFARRHVHSGLYLPTEVVEQAGEAVLVNDTSGSRSDADMAYAYGVFRSWRELYPCLCHVADADADVAAWRTFDEEEELPEQWEALGRGGTSFEPVFKAVAERHLEPALLIYITDGYCGGFAPTPSYPVLWVLCGDYNADFAPPYGKVVRVKEGRQ